MTQHDIPLPDTLAATRRDFLLSGAGGVGMMSLGALLASDGTAAADSAAHANPLVREQVVPAIKGLDNVIVCEPLDYPEFVHAQKWAHIVLTDSGGYQVFSLEGLRKNRPPRPIAPRKPH